MELRELARLALESDRLESKLITPLELTDRRPGPAAPSAPSAPGRPRGLRLDDPRPRGRFPRPSALFDPEARGRALHFFANHELLAIELMALCLLRFPEAPPSFRMGVAKTLLEEQDHLRRYRARMAELGVELGDVPVGDHFWRALAPMRAPMDYVTGMSLVFEQANLDHAARWMGLFAAADDPVTASLMRDVLEDEIGHVKHGATWFQRWRPAGDPFEVFRAELPPSLDPVRARGPRVEVEARRAAGLPESFIRALERHRAPKGRRPRFWVFTPDVEDHLAGRLVPNAVVEELIGDLAPVLGLLGSDDDVVWTPRPPRPAHDAVIAAAGLPTPKRVETVAAASGLRPDEILPWGWSPEVRRKLAGVVASTRIQPPGLDDRARLHKALVLEPRRGFAARGWLPADQVGQQIGSWSELQVLLAGSERTAWVLKAPHSASGRRRRVIEGPPTARDRAWLEAVVEAEGGVVVEPWLKRQVDLALVFPASGGRPTLLRFMTHPNGAYRGHVLGSATAALDPELAAALGRFEGGTRGLITAMETWVRRVVPTGPVGVDMLLHRDLDGQPALHPWIEINARFTMGHIAAALARRLAPGRQGVWLHLRRRDLPTLGSDDFEALASRWPPMRVRRAGPGRVHLVEGVVPTNDPAQARQVLSVLAVGKTTAGAMAMIVEPGVSS